MAVPLPATVDLARNYERIANALADRTSALVVYQWDQMPTHHRPDVETFGATIAPTVEAGQVQVAALTDAYLAQFEATARDVSADVVGIPRESVTNLRGIPTAQVYARAGSTLYWALSTGRSLDEANRFATERLRTITVTDIQAAKVAASSHVLSRNENVIGYRRVLSSGSACRLCVAAAGPGKRYRKRQLLPIHPGCSCGVAPIFGDVDPGNVNADLGQLADEETVVRTHGELGPVLASADQTFGTAPRG